MSGQPERLDWPVWRILLWAVLLSFAAAWQLSAFTESLIPQEGVFLDFCQEWLSAQNLVHGEPVYQDQNVSVTRHTGHRPKYILQWNAHPPTSVLLAVPLTGLSYPNAHLLWNLLSLLALAVSLLLVGEQLGFRLPWMLLPAAALLLVCWPFHHQISQGQLNLILLLLIVGVWTFARWDRPYWAGILLGAAAAIKLFPAFLFLYFILRRQWKSLLAGLACLSVLTGITVAVEGWESYRTYAVQVMPSVARYRSSWVNLSLTGFWSRLFDPEPVGSWQVLPIRKDPTLAWAAIILCTALLVALLAAVVRGARGREEQDGAFAITVMAMLLVSPITWDDYLLLLLLPVAWLWRRLARSWQRYLLVALLVPLWIQPRFLYWICLGLDWAKLGQLLSSRAATPSQSLTILSFQFYTLLGLFVLGLYQMTQHKTTPADQPVSA